MWRHCGGEYLPAAGFSGLYVSVVLSMVELTGREYEIADKTCRPAMATVIATQVLTIIHILKNFVVYSRANRKADRGERILEGQEGFRQTL